MLVSVSAPPASYPLSLHDALPISAVADALHYAHQAGIVWPDEYGGRGAGVMEQVVYAEDRDRKSTRLNSSHRCNSYAVFCLRKESYVGMRKFAIRIPNKGYTAP